MNYTELNEFVRHYIEQDKTQRAIMLTAAWGTGKSHYIENVLIPFLSKDENGKHDCIIVSLYGMDSISDISKAIYLEAKWNKVIDKAQKGLSKRFKRFAKPETFATGRVVAKTLLKGVTSFWSVDLSSNESDLQNLYESIDLEGKLIILEDIERSKLNILDVLGYVNNLVEHDNVKILLVANEDEMLTYELSKPDKDGNVERTLDKSSTEYLKTKEKTVSDTIHFRCDFIEAIKVIIKRFDNERLNIFVHDEGIEDILSIMRIKRCYNLRTFIFACQKTVDIFEKVTNEDGEFDKTIFYSIIAFSTIIKKGIVPRWSGSDLVSYDLGVSNFPLYRFCYNYIRWQKFDVCDIDLALEAHKKMVLYDKDGSKNDSDLNIIFSYHMHTEQEVLTALSNIEKRLDEPENIPFYDYRKLVYILISCHTILGFDYNSIKNKMIRNISGRNNEIDLDLLFMKLLEFDNPDEREQYEVFISDIKEALNKPNQDIQFFSYIPSDLLDFYNMITKEENRLMRNHVFISKFEIDKLLDMLFKCSPFQLQTFRDILFFVYRHATSHDFLEDDLLFMRLLKEKMGEKLSCLDDDFDGIAKYQIQLIIINLDMFIEQLSR